MAGWFVLCAVVAILPRGARAEDKPLNVNKPLPMKEVCLLLRGGYTGDEVLREVATRRLLDPVDPAAEKQLLAAGAAPALVNALKAGNYNLSPAEADAARARQAAIEQREQAGRIATKAVAERQQGELDGQRLILAAQQNRGQPVTPAKSAVMANLLRGQLVTFRNGQFQKYDDSKLPMKKLYAVYFSAAWCGPCQQFTPSLVKFYEKFVQIHPEFEVIFFSNDHSAAEMQQYMNTDHMPWAAVPYDHLKQMPALAKLAGSGIPDLVLLDDSGRVLSDSFRNGEYVGPSAVIKDLIAQVAPR